VLDLRRKSLGRLAFKALITATIIPLLRSLFDLSHVEIPVAPKHTDVMDYAVKLYTTYLVETLSNITLVVDEKPYIDELTIIENVRIERETPQDYSVMRLLSNDN
jgi:hypothetical protein